MIKAPDLTSMERVSHAFFTREGGISEGIYGSLNIGLGSDDSRDRVLVNRNRVCAALAVGEDALATPHQIHSANVVTVSKVWEAGDGPRADALVTNRPGIAIGVATADCGPVLFADGHAGIVGAAHSGWRGAHDGVLEATAEAMEALGADRNRLVAVLGPTISAASYEVGPEFRQRFLASDQQNSVYFTESERTGHAMFDLPGYIAMRLRSFGIGTVVDLDLCTYSDEQRFFSYRRTTHRGEPDYGRLMSAIALKGD